MRASTIIILMASLGFIFMGLLIFNSNKLKELIKNTGLYSQVDKYIRLNGKFNVMIGIIGIILGVMDYFFINQSKYIVLAFIATMFIAYFIENRITKKYKNF